MKPGDTEEKAWGRSTLVYDDGLTAVYRIFVKKGGYCSLHRHAKKSNLFLCQSGSLVVHLDISGAADMLRPFFLHPGSAPLVIKAGDWHRFTALDEVIAFEIYQAEPNTFLAADDIERLDVGGVRGPEHAVT